MPQFGYRPIEDEEMDFIELVQTFWKKRMIIIKITSAFVALGLLIALLSPVEYATEATLMPETQSGQHGSSGLLQQYGGMLGISGASSTGNNETIPPQLYPNVVQSLPYQVELMNTEVDFSKYDTTATVHEFFTDVYSSFSLMGFVKGYTIGLPSKVVDMFKRNRERKEDLRPLTERVNRDSVLTLSKEQMRTIKVLKERISISADQQTGILTINAEFPDPQAAAEIGQAAIQLLKEHVKEYRTQKARQNLDFVREQVQEARKRFEKAQQRLAEFRDSNQHLATAKAQSREQELQSQYDLTFDLYNSLSQRLEQAKLNLQEETPVLSVLQPVNVPLEKSSPNRLYILIISTMIGVVISISWILIEKWWKSEEVKIEVS